MNQKPITSRQTNGISGAWCGVLFGGCFVTLASVFLVVIIVSMVIPTIGAQRWPSTQCTILTSKVEQHQGDDGPTYSPEITFEWTVDGEKYQGGQYYIRTFSGSRSYADSVVDQYKVGSVAECFYDPDDPSNAVLNRDIGWITFLIPLIPIVFLVVGGFIVYSSLRRKNDDSRNKLTDESSILLKPDDPDFGATAYSDGSTDSEDSEDAQWAKPLQLKPAQTRLGTALGMAFFAVFWNGIVATFVYFMLTDPPAGWQRYLIWLFLTPFILIGIVLIFGMISSFMQLFNPIVNVALSSGAVPLGGTVDLAWEVSGRVSAIKKLTITIRAIESATYRRGTSTYTDTSAFALIPVADVTTQHEMRFGSVQANIPQTTMHTADFGNNSIVWTIEVAGEISWWPDLKESYVFRVTPS
jgi:hypothetical protein